jgi:uncharacterized membrane protein (DUF373 family)
MFKQKIRRLFDNTVDVIFGLILLFLIIGIAIGALQLFRDIWILLRFEGITGKYIDMISDVLTLYVLIELSRSLIEYFDNHKLRLTFIIDAAIVFIIRELLIGFFKHDIKPDMLIAITILLFVLGMIRISSVLVYQREKTMISEIESGPRH